jgi:epoxyqueuosine reductase QueG
VSVQQQGLPAQLQLWGRQLGFSQIGVAPVDLSHAEPGLLAWLAAGHHRNGVLLAAITAELVANQICASAPPQGSWEQSFRWDRFCS